MTWTLITMSPAASLTLFTVHHFDDPQEQKITGA
jgi:hypothetical protein